MGVTETESLEEPGAAPVGEPSAEDFIRLDLFGIQEEVAERFDDLPVETTLSG